MDAGALPLLSQLAQIAAAHLVSGAELHKLQRGESLEKRHQQGCETVVQLLAALQAIPG